MTFLFSVFLLITIASCPGPAELFGKVEEAVRISGESQGNISKPEEAPSDLTAVPADPWQINLSWTDNSSNEDFFQIQVKIGEVYQNLQSVDPDCMTYYHIGLNPDTNYWYRVRAVNSAGASDWSEEVSASTPPDPSGSASQDAKIETLQFSAGVLDKDFSPWITEYQLTVLYEMSELRLVVFPSEDHATLEINGESVSPGEEFPLDLDTGTTEAAIVVTAQAGNSLTYTVELVQLADSTLSSIEIQAKSPDGISNSALYPEFTSTSTDYYVQISSVETAVAITATLPDPQNTLLKIDGATAVSGYEYEYSVAGGECRTIILEVSAGEGIYAHSRSYVLNVYKPLTNMAITGQRVSYEAGDDGALERGLDWTVHTVERFALSDAGGGWYIMEDRFTGLKWAHPSFSLTYTWSDALAYAQTVEIGTASEAGWRMPNINELESLVNYHESTAGWLPLTVLESSMYWTSTSIQSTSAYAIHMEYGYIIPNNKINTRNLLLVKER